MTEHPDRGLVLASFQRAMLGVVTPELRAVLLDLTQGVRVRFVYAVEVDDEIRDLVDDVETEMLADLEPDVPVEAVIETDPDGPVTVTDPEFLAFRRHE